MAAITIRNLDDDVKASLRIVAAQNGRSMEEEARRILRAALIPQRAPSAGLGTRIHERFAQLGGVELDLPPRDEPARAAAFRP
ncbi:MAG: toxin-antitoxin system [Micrococcales bacterium]|nr:toxin-antitoxin system [Micrococcales bacterium]